MKYSFNAIESREGIAFAQRYEMNASYKDLCAVCDAIRYRRASDALKILENVAALKAPIEYRRHNKHMGARHELHGRKGKYPSKAAKEVRLALVNAIANALNNAMDGNEMVVIHASANKTHIERRYPSKGSLAWGRGMYGRSAMMHSDLEYSKVEIALAEEDNPKLTEKMKYFIGKRSRKIEKKEKAAKKKA